MDLRPPDMTALICTHDKLSETDPRRFRQSVPGTQLRRREWREHFTHALAQNDPGGAHETDAERTKRGAGKAVKRKALLTFEVAE